MIQTKKTTLIWIALLALFIGLFFLFKGILTPFVLGFVLAYMLNPFVNRLQKYKFTRNYGALAVILALFVLILLCFLILFPLLESQVLAFIDKLPTLSATLQTRLQPIFEKIKNSISSTQMTSLKASLASQGTHLIKEFSEKLIQVFSGWGALVDIISYVIITPVVVFYLLADWDKITQTLKSLIPNRNYNSVMEKLDQIDTVLSAFIRGQALVCLFLGLFYGLGLSLVGLDFGFSIGFISGVFSFIPYVGTLTGFVLSLLLAFSQSASISLFVAIVVVFLIGQFLEGYILTPKLVGNKIHLHPVWVIFALLAGGYLFGFLGILCAVPCASVIGVLVRSLIQFYKTTAFYKGD